MLAAAAAGWRSPALLTINRRSPARRRNSGAAQVATSLDLPAPEAMDASDAGDCDRHLHTAGTLTARGGGTRIQPHFSGIMTCSQRCGRDRERTEAMIGTITRDHGVSGSASPLFVPDHNAGSVAPPGPSTRRRVRHGHLRQTSNSVRSLFIAV
jgi:hypothetical protein